MVFDSSSASGTPAARSPLVYALYGAGATVAVVALLALLFWPEAAAPPGADTAGPPGGGFGFGPAPVEVAEAVETMAAEPVQLIGSVAPVREAVVASEVEGMVAEVLVDEGDRVREGDVLARLRTTTLELDLAAARANRAEAAARLVRYESEVVRITDLRERGAVSEREFEQAIADRDAQAQAVTRYESEAARLEELITQALIVAPFPGQISAVHAEVGEWTGRGGDVVTLVDVSRVEVTVQVPERYVSQVEEARRVGVAVPVVFDALEGRYTGTVKAVVPQANPQARTFPAIVTVANPDGLIRAGMSARVLAQVGDPVPTVLVPKDALVLRSGRTFVFRVVAGPPGAPGGGAAPEGTGQAEASAQPPPSMVEELEVDMGTGYGAWQVVRGGIVGGDVVVVRGNESLRPGAPVMITGQADIEPPPTPAADLPTGRRREESR